MAEPTSNDSSGRNQPGSTHVITIGALTVDPLARRVYLDHKPVHLSALEFDLLAYVARHAGRAITYGCISGTVSTNVRKAPFGHLRLSRRSLAQVRKCLENKRIGEADTTKAVWRVQQVATKHADVSITEGAQRSDCPDKARVLHADTVNLDVSPARSNPKEHPCSQFGRCTHHL